MDDKFEIVAKSEDQALVRLANQFEKEAEQRTSKEGKKSELIQPIEFFYGSAKQKEMVAPIKFFKNAFEVEVVKEKEALARKYQKELQLPATPTLILEEPIAPIRKSEPQFSGRYFRYPYGNNSPSISLIDLEEFLLQTLTLKRYREDLFVYTGTHYRYTADNEVKGLILECLRNNLRETNASAQINSLLALLKAEIQICGQPDDSPHLLAVQNGELDLEHFRLYPSTPKHFHVHYVDAPWLGYQPCPQFQKFLKFVSGNHYELKQRILEVIGYLLVPDNHGKRFVFLQGVGDSGKSVLGTLLKSFIEPSALAGVSAHQLGDRFSASFLAHRQLNVSMDLPGGVLDQKAVAVLKQITGGDVLSVEGKNREAYADHLRCKMLFGSNHPLILKAHDEAFAKRVLLVPFRFPVPEEQMDRNLPEKLKKEKSGILYLALTAYREVVRRNYQFSGEERFGFKPQQIIIQEASQTYVENFVTARCILEDNSFTPTEALHHQYIQFCKQSGKAAISDRAAFSRALKAHLGEQVQSTKRRVEGTPLNGYIGIKLKEA